MHGTVNDVATPLWLGASFILEEGLPLADLMRIARSTARAEAQRVVDSLSKKPAPRIR